MPRISLDDLARWKREGRRFVCLTAYDAPTGRILEGAGVPLLLVGDSVGNVVLGHRDTLPVTMEIMLHHAAAVRRGARETFIIGDMPFGSFQVSAEEAVRNAARFLQGAGMDAVKVEGGAERAETVRAIVAAGIPTMGHLGLTPQNATQLGGLRVQATDAAGAERLLEDARSLERAGAFAIVLECVPEEVAAIVTEGISIPTIGIGAGRRTDGQVLVIHDLIGISAGFSPRFVRAYSDVEARIAAAAQAFRRDVESGAFPGEKEIFSLPPEALAELRRRIAKGGAS